MPGADINPYLGSRRCWPPGWTAIEKETRPGAGAGGQRLRGGRGEAFPSDTLREARELWEGSEFARDAFGEEVVRLTT